MSYLFLILIYYLMLFSPSFVASPFSLLIALPFLFFSRARKKAMLYMFLMLSASRILDVSLLQIPFSMDSVREVGITAIEDGAVKRYGKYGFPAQLYYAHDGLELFSSASGEIYVYSDKQEVRAGDSLSCHGSFRKGNFFTADKVFAIEDGALRKVRKHGEALLRKRLSILPDQEGNLALMLLLALSDDGEAEVAALGREKGVSHVFALSGMHLSLISSLLIPLIGSVAGRRRAEKIVMLPLLVFTFLSGFRASLLRALIFRALFTFFPSMERDDVFAMTFSIHAMLFPQSLMRAGAVFSYLSVAGLLLLSDRLESLSFRVLRMRLSFIFTSLSCLLFTIPYSYAIFGEYTLSGIIYTPPVNFLVSLYMALLLLFLVLPIPSAIFTFLYSVLMKILSLPYFSEPSDDFLPYFLALFVTALLILLSFLKRREIAIMLRPCGISITRRRKRRQPCLKDMDSQ